MQSNFYGMKFILGSLKMPKLPSYFSKAERLMEFVGWIVVLKQSLFCWRILQIVREILTQSSKESWRSQSNFAKMRESLLLFLRTWCCFEQIVGISPNSKEVSFEITICSFSSPKHTASHQIPWRWLRMKSSKLLYFWPHLWTRAASSGILLDDKNTKSVHNKL